MEIRSLSGINMKILHQAREEAFRDYPQSWDRPAFERMLKRRGYAPELSFGAFDGGRMVGFVLNGTGIYRGVRAAYDTGTGTIPEYRGRGLTSLMLDAAIPALRAAGYREYVLEVLADNAAAVKVYRRAGFETCRELNYFIQPLSGLDLSGLKDLSAEVKISEADLSRQKEMEQMWDVHPSWQNSFASLQRDQGRFRILGAFVGQDLIAYGVIEEATGDLPQLAVQPEHRRQGIGTQLLKALLTHNKAGEVRIINADASAPGITSFLAGLGIRIAGRQLEMIRPF